MMTNSRLGFLASVVLLYFLFDGFSFMPEYRIKLNVIDEVGSPLNGVLVQSGFDQSGIVGGRQQSFEIQSCGDGSVRFRGRTVFSFPAFFEKEGYYDSKIIIDPTADKDRFIEKTVMLRKKISPVPLYARRVFLDLPMDGVVRYFDFVRSDWVAPHGQGEQAHIGFKLSGKAKTPSDYTGTLDVLFENHKDGVQLIDNLVSKHSEIQIPREAPTEKYLSSLSLEKYSGPTRPGVGIVEKVLGEEESYHGLFIRTLSETDADGNVTSANYAKIWKKIGFTPYFKSLSFYYYYNPVRNDTNLEFDVSRGLLDISRSRERIKVP